MPRDRGKATRQYGATPLIASLAVESSGPLCPMIAERYTPSSPKTRLFHIMLALTPTTRCAKFPSMSVVAAGVGAMDEEAQGKLQAGVVFHRSWIVGLLFTERPTSAPFENSLALSANRRSTLSIPNDPSGAEYVTWTKAPVFGLTRPPMNRLSWSGRRALPFWVPGWALCVAV